MKFKPYPKYKASGVEWLGDVPAHWVKRTLQHSSKTTQYSFVDGPFGSDLKNEEYVDAGIPLIQLNNIGIGIHSLGKLKFVTEEKATVLSKHTAVPGDIVIAKMADPVARAAVVDNQFPLYLIVADCIKLAINPAAYNVQYIQYWINSPIENAIAESLSSGITRVRINLGVVKKLPLFEFDLHEQDAIATFLDRETAKIDTLIAKQEKLIDLLKEKRQAVISHAVTKGLDPNVPMKPSGVEWLGDVPEHWDVPPIRAISQVVRGASPRPAGDPKFFNGDHTPWVTVGEITKDSSMFLTETSTMLTTFGAEQSRLFSSGTLVLSNSGATLGVPKILLIDVCANDGVVGFESLATTVDIQYFYYYLLSLTQNLRERIKQGSGQPNLNTDIVKDIRLGLPPLREQERIVGWINGQLAIIDTLIAKAQQAIALQKEHRTALISAAVTGKIDVRGEITVRKAA